MSACSEVPFERAWKLIPLARADAHQMPPTHSRSTTSLNIDMHPGVPVNDGVSPGSRGACDTVLTQSLFSRRPMCACMRLDLAMFAGEVTTEPAQHIEPTQR